MHGIATVNNALMSKQNAIGITATPPRYHRLAILSSFVLVWLWSFVMIWSFVMVVVLALASGFEHGLFLQHRNNNRFVGSDMWMMFIRVYTLVYTRVYTLVPEYIR